MSDASVLSPARRMCTSVRRRACISPSTNAAEQARDAGTLALRGDQRRRAIAAVIMLLPNRASACFLEARKGLEPGADRRGHRRYNRSALPPNRDRRLELRQLRYALSVAKERSFTRAATRLNVSQSAVSEQVSLLENEIGFPLFRRTPRGIELTERGRTFLYETERVIGDVLSLSDTARRLRGAPSDTLTLGMGSGMA